MNTAPEMLQPLTIDVSIEYKLDMRLFPGLSDPIARGQPALLLHQPSNCPCGDVFKDFAIDENTDIFDDTSDYNWFETSDLHGDLYDYDVDCDLSMYANDLEPPAEDISDKLPASSPCSSMDSGYNNSIMHSFDSTSTSPSALTLSGLMGDYFEEDVIDILVGESVTRYTCMMIPSRANLKRKRDRVVDCDDSVVPCAKLSKLPDSSFHRSVPNDFLLVEQRGDRREFKWF